MANTRRASFRLGEETERQLEQLAEFSESTRTEVVRALVSARYMELHSVEEPRRGKTDPAQMNLDEVLSPEVGAES